MTISAKTLFAGAALISALAVGGSVSAATVIVPFDGSPFSLSNPIGTLPATAMTKGNTYDFTFSIVNPIGGATPPTHLPAPSPKPATAPLVPYNPFSRPPGPRTAMSDS